MKIHARKRRRLPSVRDDCFAGETLQPLVDARELAERWCRHDYGARRHTRTQRLPLECFEAEEKPRLLSLPAERYEVPQWFDPKVGRDHLAQVAKALYSLPTRFIGQRLRARADRTLVRFYAHGALVKTHTRQLPGGRSIDPSDFPAHKTAYALRDVAFLKRQAAEHGEAIGRFADALLDVPLPWTRMRRVYALLGMVRRYGAERVEQTCRVALDVAMFDVQRLERMVLAAAAPAPTATGAAAPKTASPARHLRPASAFALPFITTTN